MFGTAPPGKRLLSDCRIEVWLAAGEVPVVFGVELETFFGQVEWRAAMPRATTWCRSRAG